MHLTDFKISLLNKKFFKWNSLITKVIVTFLAVSLIPLGFLFFLSVLNLKASILDRGNHALMAAASQTASSIDSFIDNNINAVDSESQLSVFINYLTMPANLRSGSTEEIQALSILYTLSRKDQVNIQSYALIDQYGQTLLDTYTPNIKSDKSIYKYFSAEIKTGVSSASSIEFINNGNALIYFYSPVRDTEAGENIGILCVRYNASILEQIIVQNYGLAGMQSFALLLDENYLCLAHGTDLD